MKYKLVKLNKLSGNQTSIYSLYLEEKRKTLFDLFLEEYRIAFKGEINDILSRIMIMGHKTGAKEDFFKHNEGKPGDGVCALFDRPHSKLRLYCIRYGSLILILGGGGFKPKAMRSFQEDGKLTKENYFLRDLSEKIKARMEEGEVAFSSDYMDFDGDLTFYDNEDEKGR